ncbi:MAG: GNAT family N-acetyltransferase [Candidatus Thermoplasmatota archaeon]
MRVRKITKQNFEAVIEIAKRLRITDDGRKGWFTKDAVEKHMPLDIGLQKGFVAVEGGEVVGFATYTSCGCQPTIGWIAVERGSHRKGVGAALVERCAAEVRKAGGRELFVETPSREAGIGTEYEKTYMFYEGVGFRLHRIRKRDDPDNNCGCDMAILKKVLK